jgi:hypothetical protein
VRSKNEQELELDKLVDAISSVQGVLSLFYLAAERGGTTTLILTTIYW